MKTILMPKFKKEDFDKFMADKALCESYGNTADLIEDIDKLLAKHGLELVHHDDGSSEFIIGVELLVPKLSTEKSDLTNI